MNVYHLGISLHVVNEIFVNLQSQFSIRNMCYFVVVKSFGATVAL